MATTLTQDIRVKISSTFSNALDLTSTADVLDKQYKVTTANGTSSGQADLRWHDTRTLASGASENLDLAGGVTDPFGNAITFAKVKGIVMKNNASTAGENFTVGGASSNAAVLWFGAATHTETLKAGGILLHEDDVQGWSVTAGTGDILKVTNAGTLSNTYDITIWGTSA